MNAPLYMAAVSGVMLGLFVILHFYVTGRAVGCSSAYGNFCAYTCNIPFFHRGEFAVRNHPRLWLLFGLPLGGFLYVSTLGDGFHLSFNMGIYDAILPSTVPAKALWLMLAGFLLGFGARLAGACTTGHVLVGGALLNPISLMTGAIFFVTALITTQLLFLG
ncbi:MAG: YeeE/YedE family protein [Thiotrichales bacterium]|jgi:hypothetical protein|nr:YeeE/YedE family protein [Pseudomonadota bacterium]MCI4410138.1 YeeE/YedE family protein [Thiotrichales bacterium]